MKRFEIITEADARVLEPGETVLLADRGQITPLAADTLRQRRITVLRNDQVDPAHEQLPPVAEIRRIAIASDHTGVTLKAALVAALRTRGLAVDDLGTTGTEAVDYPDTAAAVARSVARREADAGIVIDGSGIGSAIAANKVKGIRAAVCHDVTTARYARAHNGANVLSLGSTLVSVDDAMAVVDTWLGTAMREPRYIRRLAKLHRLEEQAKP
jgi:ribose 5-phosphate isomerase B